MKVRKALHGILVLVAASLTVVGCGGGKKNKAPDPVIESPHEGSSHLPINNINFDGRATDPEDGVIGSAAMRWEVLNSQNAVVFASPGASVNATLPNAGDYVVRLYAMDSDGKEGRATTTIRVGNTTAELTNPDNFGFVGISTPFDLDGRAETIAPATTIATMTFVGVDRDTNVEAFRTQVAAAAANCNVATTVCTATVTPPSGVPAGRYKLTLEVATTVPAESAIDTLYVIADSAPVVAITSPVDGSHIAPGTQVAFAGTATDPAGDELTISWTSSVEGAIGSQLSFNRSDLATAKHQIHLTATDPNGLSSTATIDLYIEDPGAPLFVSNVAGDVADVQGLGWQGDVLWFGTATNANQIGTVTTAGLVAGNPFGTTGNSAATSVLVARNGDVLVSTAAQSVDRISGGTLGNVANGALDANVFDAAQNATTGDYYFATAVGLTVANEGLSVFAEFGQNGTALGALGNNTTNSVAVGADGAVYVGTDGDALLKLTDLSGTPGIAAITQDQGLCGDVVWEVAVAPDGRVWAGCDGGLSVYDPIANTVVTYDNLPDDRVHALAFSPGVVWIGTESNVTRLDLASDRVTVLDGADLASPWVEDIAIDGSGDKYFACSATGGGGGQGGGITRYIGE